VLPYPHDGVAFSPQSAAYSVVAAPVLVDLAKPKGAPICRHISRATLAAMPKAAVNKDGQHVLREKEIWFSNNVGGMFYPALDLMGLQNIFNSDFCRAISVAPNRGH
jgi:hypothetical protein